MRVLIVKVSSLGDVIHTLPALTDAMKAIPSIEFEWVVEEAYTEIPVWHPAVKKVIPVAFRRLKRNPVLAWFSAEYRNFKKHLKKADYDLVIDAQGLIKSGFICSLVPARTVGFDKDSIREKLATRFYDESYPVSREQHAVERTRQLFARALGYSLEGKPLDYGIDLNELPETEMEPKKSLLFLHGTTWATKEWPEAYWKELGTLACADGWHVNLLWGTENEKLRANRIADELQSASVLNHLHLSSIAALMQNCGAVIAVDTGLAHLAAALGRPTVALYGASDMRRTGTYGQNQVHMSADFPCSPCLKRQCEYRGDELDKEQAEKIMSVFPPCFSTLPPNLVWRQVVQLSKGQGRST